MAGSLVARTPAAPGCPGVGAGAGGREKALAGAGEEADGWHAVPPLPLFQPRGRARARVSSSLPPISEWGLEELKSAMRPLALVPSLFPKGQQNPEPREGHQGQEMGARPGPAADSAFWSETEDIGLEATTL